MGNFPTNFFRPYRMTSSQLNNFPCVQGQLIFTTDDRRIYIDTTNAKAGRLEVAAEAITNVELGTDKRTLTFTKADGSTFNHKIVVDIDSELDAQSLNPVQNAVVSAAINATQSDIEDIFEAIVALEKKNSSLEDAVEQNAGDITDNLNAINANTSAIQVLQGNVQTLTNADEALQNNINTNNANIDINASNISSLQTSVNNLNKKDEELQGSLNDVSNTLTNFQTTTNNNFTTVNENITKIVNGTTVVKKAESATSATSAGKATNDGNGKNIANTYETKANAASNVASLQTYAEAKADAALNSAKSDAASKISAHNIATDTHNDIRLLISGLSTQVNEFLDVTDDKRDQLSEVLQLIDNNKGTLDSLTTNKINKSDIVDDLVTSSSDKVLSAKQGAALKASLDTLSNTAATKTELSAHIDNTNNPHKVTKEQVGLSDVNNTSDADKPVSEAQAVAIADAKKAGIDAQLTIDNHETNTNNPHNVTLAQLGVNVTADKLNLVDGVTSDIQEQLNNKANKDSVPTTYAGSSSAGGAADSALKLSFEQTIGLSGDVTGSANFDGSKSIIIDVAVVDDSHNHITSNIDGLDNTLSSINTKLNASINELSVSGTTVTYTKTDGTTGSITTQDTTYSNATDSKDGLMSSVDKAKIDNMPQFVFCTKEQYAAYGDIVQTDRKIYFIN